MANKTQVSSKGNRRESVLKTLDRAAEIVSDWPDWKQDALGSLRLPSSTASRSSPKQELKKSNHPHQSPV